MPAGPPEAPPGPRMIPFGSILGPAAPRELKDTDLDAGALADLALKLAYTVPHLSTEWATRRLLLPLPLVHELLDRLRSDRMLDLLGQLGPFNYRYAIGQRGRERAGRLLEISGYVGPAPVSLAAYAHLLEWQTAQSPSVSPRDIASAIAELVLPAQVIELAGLAASSMRSLFVYGPPGNGKTSLGRLLHRALRGDLWIPHCIAIDSSIIRVFDAQVHQQSDLPAEQPGALDRRWVRIRRPLIVLGGEVTLDSFDLAYSPALRYYEAPLHLKANGGTLLIDDFGRERADPRQMLNRLITPLEHQIDYLTLHTGQKIQVPLRQLLIIATNLSPDEVTDPAFLRRMGYRLYLGPPSPEQYVQIFERYAASLGAAVPPGLPERVLDRYRNERRELRCCEPRDLIERVRDICRFRDQPLELNEEVLDLAWTGYFGGQGA